jgi:predicted O-methyltransferase YrrM
MEKRLEDFLKELKKYGIKKHIPNISEEKGRFLNLLAKTAKAKKILEIGCANGYSTIWLAEAAKTNGGKVTAIDFCKPSYKAALKNISSTGFADTVKIILGNALDMIPDLNAKFDFIFVDGEKRSYLGFWNAIQGKLQKNAIIVFDDIVKFPAKTVEFMEKIKNMVGFDQVILPIDKNDEILILYKTF